MIAVFCVCLVTVFLGILFWREVDGANRRANQKIRGNPAQRADASGGPVYQAGPSGTIVPINLAVGAGQNPGAGKGLSAAHASYPQHVASLNLSNNNAFLRAISRQHQNAIVGTAISIGLDDREPRHPVENIGIVLGEVEAFRAWRVFDGLLVSMAIDFVWMPGEPMTANEVTDYGSSGVHGFKTHKQAAAYAFQYANGREYVIGRVKLWGQIIEHETGYRAEFAKPIELINQCHGFTPLHMLVRAPWTIEAIAARYNINWRAGEIL